MTTSGAFIVIFLTICCCATNFAAEEGVCDVDGCDKDNSQNCVVFDPRTFNSQNASIFVIESKGRLGNHLVGYTTILAIAKVINIQPMIVEETHTYLSRYFGNISVPIVQKTFCNWESMQFERYYEGIEELIKDESLRRGRLLELWPNGYKVESRICCPAEELQKFVQDNYLDETKNALTFQPKFQEYANDLRERAAKKLELDTEDVTFVGIHNRRTDYMNYMTHMFGETKNPYTKRYFKDAMNYFREEHENTVFFFVSDDMEWGRQNIKSKHKDLYFVGKGDTDDPDSIGYDLALLASCNHTVMTWGTFSMWAAVLSGGEYYTKYGVIVPSQQQTKKRKKKKKTIMI